MEQNELIEEIANGTQDSESQIDCGTYIDVEEDFATFADEVKAHVELMLADESFAALSHRLDASESELQHAAGNVWSRSGDQRLAPFRCVNGQKSAMMKWHLAFSHSTNAIAFAKTKQFLDSAYDIAVGMSLTISMMLEEHSRFGLTREQADRYCGSKRKVLQDAHAVALARLEFKKGAEA